MASNVPIAKQIAWIALLPQLALVGLLIYIFHALGYRTPAMLGVLSYYVLALVLRNLVARSHRKGMRLVKQQRYAEAVPCFEKSVEYFTENKWVDDFRFLTLLSYSQMTYQEMGLCNIAFCYSQLGNGQMAKKYYEQTLDKFPENSMAIAALNLINSVKTT